MRQWVAHAWQTHFLLTRPFLQSAILHCFPSVSVHWEVGNDLPVHTWLLVALRLDDQDMEPTGGGKVEACGAIGSMCWTN